MRRWVPTLSDPEPISGDGSLLIPVFEGIDGRCLQLGSPSPGWSRLLESYASQVVTAGPVTPSENRQIPTSTFETVAAACRTRRLEEVASVARRALRSDGSLLLAVDGWPHQLRQDHASPVRALANVPRSNAWNVRRTLRNVGFEEITLYGVYPSIAEPKYVYPLSNDSAVEWLIETRLSGWMQTGARAANAIGVFDEGQPGYLALCEPSGGDKRPDSTVTRVSLNRVVTFELDETGPVRVRKAPRLAGGDATIRREQHVLDELLEDETNVRNEVTNALPEGTLATSPIGAVRSETPATGTLVGSRLDTDPVAVGHVLDDAFDWLASFQRAYRGERILLDPEDLRDRARCPALDATDPVGLDESVASFVAPCHGDFHPWNVYGDEDGVSTVIDWEYAKRRSDPAIDPAHFLLYVCAQVGEDFAAGFDLLCASETRYSAVVRESLGRYCDRVGLSRRSVVGALPYAHVHTMRVLRQLGEPPAFAKLRRKYASRVETIAENFDAVVETLGQPSP